MATIESMTVRFFAYDYEGNDVDIIETDENDFLAALEEPGTRIEYERHTVRENGVSQICLTVVR